MEKIAVIPARGGSKRILRKNIKDFAGKPMIAHAIGIAKSAGIFGRIIVSSDDVEIAEVAKNYGAEVPFMRPSELSDDFCATIPVIRHAISVLKIREEDAVCCIYPTAVLLTPQTLTEAAKKLESTQGYLFGAVAYDYPPQRSFTLRADSPSMLFSEHFNTRSQDLEPIFHDAGQFYFARAKNWQEQDNIFAPPSKAIKLPQKRVQDIDTMEDFELALLKYRLLESS